MFSYHQMMAHILGLIPSRYDTFVNVDNGLMRVSGHKAAIARKQCSVRNDSQSPFLR